MSGETGRKSYLGVALTREGDLVSLSRDRELHESTVRAWQVFKRLNRDNDPTGPQLSTFCSTINDFAKEFHEALGVDVLAHYSNTVELNSTAGYWGHTSAITNASVRLELDAWTSINEQLTATTEARNHSGASWQQSTPRFQPSPLGVSFSLTGRELVQSPDSQGVPCDAQNRRSTGIDSQEAYFGRSTDLLVNVDAEQPLVGHSSEPTDSRGRWGLSRLVKTLSRGKSREVGSKRTRSKDSRGPKSPEEEAEAATAWSLDLAVV